MQLGIGTYTYGWSVGVPGDRPENPLDEQGLLDQASAFGVRLVQFGDNWPLHELPAERLNALQQRAKVEKVALEIGARGLTEARLGQYLMIAHSLNSRLLRFVIDETNYKPAVDDIISLIRNALPVLTIAGLTLGLENHDRLSAREFARIVEQVGSPNVGICLDSVNSMGAGEGLTEVVHILAPYTVNLHLKDFGIRRLPHQMGFQIDGRPAGQGLLNVPWLVERVAQHGLCRTAILEQWVVPEDAWSATITKEQEWATESMTYLQQTGLFTDD